MTAAAIHGPVQTDPYPTRLPPGPQKPSMLPRLEPVIHGQSRARPGNDGLTSAMARRFSRDGFLVLRGFFCASEVDQFRREADRLASVVRARPGPEAFCERGTTTLRSLFDVPRFSTLFARLAESPRLTHIVRDILDDDVYLHQTRLNFKPAFRGKDFYWHSDFETWHAEDGMPRMRAVSASISLTPNTAVNGPLLLIPGSHRRFVPCRGRTPDDHYRASLVKQEYGVPDEASLTALVARGGIRAATGPPGTVVLFDCNVMHGSNSNISPEPRSNLFFVYNARANALGPPAAGTAPRPEFVAARNRPMLMIQSM